MEGSQLKVAEWTPEHQKRELKRRLESMVSVMRRENPTNYQPLPDDVIVAVPNKHGTTWLLHICHQIRMKGQEPDFEDQFDVVGWIEASERAFGVDMSTKPQAAKPRVFLTHLPYAQIPAGGKRVYCFRNQKDMVVSAYYFLDSVLLLNGRVSMPVFATAILQRVKNNLNDLLLWWEHRHDDNVLLVFFDDLKEDHEGGVHQIAKFMDVKLDEDAIARVVHTTSHAEMSRQASKFTVRKAIFKIREAFGEACPPSLDSEFVSRVRKDDGKSGEGKQKLPVEVQQHIDQMWQDIVTSKLGFKDLKEMREVWRKEY